MPRGPAGEGQGQALQGEGTWRAPPAPGHKQGVVSASKVGRKACQGTFQIQEVAHTSQHLMGPPHPGSALPQANPHQDRTQVSGVVTLLA